MPAALTEVHPRAVEHYLDALHLHRDAMVANREGRRAEAEFLRGLSLVVRRWGDDAAAAESAAEMEPAR